VEFLPQGSTINAGVYCDTLKKLCHEIQNKWRGKLVGVLWCFVTMPAHTLPPKRKISSPHWAGNNSINPCTAQT
jgi:hypothetical protein